MNRLQKTLAPIGRAPWIKMSVSIFSYGIVPIIGLGVSIVSPLGELFRKFGELAQLGLFVILFMKPIAFIVPLNFLKRALTYRRQMGVTVFWLAFFHSIGFLYTNGLWSLDDFLGWKNHYFYGGIAMVAMTILGVTSNDRSLRLFRRNWKRIQYLTYPTLFLVLLHVSLVKGEMVKLYVVGGLFLLLKFLEAKRFRLDEYIPFIKKLGL